VFHRAGLARFEKVRRPRFQRVNAARVMVSRDLGPDVAGAILARGGTLQQRSRKGKSHGGWKGRVNPFSTGSLWNMAILK
jgi:hypothetical protein